MSDRAEIAARPMMVACVESLTDALRREEIQPLLPEHWEELAIYKDRMPLAPNYPRYYAADARGEVAFVALRRTGALVGYFICFLDLEPLHYSTTPSAKMDLIYVKPEYRGRGGHMLRLAMRDELKRRGIKVAWVGSKDHHPIEGFWAAEGFERQESYWTEWLGDDE